MGEERKTLGIVCKAGGERMSLKLTILVCIVLLGSCSPAKKLVYLDEWEGHYTLKRYGCCGEEPTQIRLNIVRSGVDTYEWKMFGFETSPLDTLTGKAKYERKKLKFFVSNIDVARRHFASEVYDNDAVFKIEWDNYYSEGDKLFVDYYTRWNNELVNYRSQNRLFAGVDYHFKSEEIPQKILYRNK